ncbi:MULTISPECIES: hypothetical protein [unclassified Methylobacterium]|jgi:hypothetical protein|uniref:hypothetical protein n=1 Tax=unclassified Methylobacterium TaxID=2615210 RepID=UPI001352AC56|nr:hypothetical protein [Methylobacterium sp. 2A]MWV23356.1 hypothetical protein [Methylobacterium sp. 2A]
MPGRPRRRYTAFLVAVTPERSRKAPRPVVYAVMKPNAEEALEAVRGVADARAAVALVGSLSTRIAKALKLKPDEPRTV